MCPLLRPIHIERPQHRCDIAPKSILCILVCTVTPGRSDVAVRLLQMALQPIWEQHHSDVADASLSLDVNGPLLRSLRISC